MQKVVLDIETVGLKCGFHEITEVSILDCQTLEQKTWFIKVQHPERASKEALMITNKNIKELCTRGDLIQDVIPQIEEFLVKISENDPDNLCCIGHNVSFDRRFLEDAFNVAGKKFPANYWLCTMDMSKKFSKNILKIAEKMSFALSNMCKLASITTPNDMHTSAADVQVTYKLYMYMKTRGMSDSLFIKLSPALLSSVSKASSKIKKVAGGSKKASKAKDDVGLIDDIGLDTNPSSDEDYCGAVDFDHDDDDDDY